MNRYAYRIHYNDDPRRIGHIPMDSDELSAALGRFRDALPRYMAEMNATAELLEPMHRRGNAIRVVVNTVLDWAKMSAAMAGYADRHGLRATHVMSTLPPALAAAATVRSFKANAGSAVWSANVVAASR